VTFNTESITLRPMEKRDFRSLGRETQEALRVRAVFLVLQLHKTQAEAAEAVGVSRQIVNQWLRNYASEGEKALLDRRKNAHRRGVDGCQNARLFGDFRIRRHTGRR
jgi:transposase